MSSYDYLSDIKMSVVRVWRGDILVDIYKYMDTTRPGSIHSVRIHNYVYVIKFQIRLCSGITGTTEGRPDRKQQGYVRTRKIYVRENGRFLG
jgi:hypothetical protein